MIRNIDQYQTTKHWLTKYELTVRLLNAYTIAGDVLHVMKVNALNSQIEIFKNQMKDYETSQQGLVK